MEAGLLVYGEYERIDALEAGASRAPALRPQTAATGGASALSCRPAEVLSWRVRGAIAGPDAAALRTRLGDRARSLSVASVAPVLADK